MILLLQFLIATLALAFPRSESFICPGVQLAPQHGILCCDGLPGKNCEETQAALLSSPQITYLNEMSAEIVALPESVTIVQNCFRTAVELEGLSPINSAPMLGPESFFKTLESAGYEELAPGLNETDLRPGDILVFDEEGLYQAWEENENTSGKHPYWYEDQITDHAMVYLGDGLVVQKENTFTAVASITTLTRTFAINEAGAKANIDKSLYSQKKISLLMRTFRRKAQASL